MSKKARTKNSAPNAAAGDNAHAAFGAATGTAGAEVSGALNAHDAAMSAALETAALEQEGANVPTGGVLTGSGRPDAEQIYAPLLSQPHAPQGKLSEDFKTALYVCAATKHYSFEETVAKGSLPLLGYMLASVGYHGETRNLTMADYESTLQELVHEGALEYIGMGAGFVAPAFKAERQGYVSCITSKTYVFDHATTELRFNDDSGQYPLFSKFVVIPGDDVSVVINTFNGVAYVTAITKMRTMLTGEVSSNRQIFFREKGFLAYDVRVTKDGVPTKIGDLVVAEILARKSPNVLVVRVREVVHDTGALNTFIVKAVLEHELPNTWPDAVKRSIKSIPDKVAASERKGRVDLRALPLVTIDGEDAKDFDDAVYCERQGDKFHLYVAIADVSYYVRTGSAIDAEAHERTTSVYFPFYVIPMLPEELSNGICSLNPKVDRLCMVCDMIINARGAIEKYQFYPAVMNSHARLTYTEAHQMITTGKAIQEEHQECVPWVKTLYELYQVLKKARDQRGVFEIESTEVHFLFDEKWEITGMEAEERNEAHMLIEECMIAANVCAATFAKTLQYETLYRIHDRPNEKKLDKLRAILSRYGIDLGGGEKPSTMDFKRANDQIKKLDESVQGVIGLQMLRAMSKAQYSPDNIGHFGLALENYAHFTSPIRRYPDLQLHRVIKFILEKQEKRSWGKIGAQLYTHEALVALGMRCSEREIAADDAEFDVDNSLKCEYLKHFEGEVVDGTVSTVSDMGAFITLNDFYIDGLLPNTEFSKRNVGDQCFEVPGIKNTFHVGDQIKVRVLKVDSLNRFITLRAMINLKKSDKSFDLKARQSQLLAKSNRELRPDNTAKNEFFERIADISQGKAPEDKDQITRDQRDYSLADKLSAPSKGSKKAKAQKPAAAEPSAPTDIHEELKARAKQFALGQGAEDMADLDEDALVDVAVAAATAKIKSKAKAKATKGATKGAKAQPPAAAAAAPEAPAASADQAPTEAAAASAAAQPTVTVKRKGSKAQDVTLEGAPKATKTPKAAQSDLLSEAAALIDADIGTQARTSTKSAPSAEPKSTATTAKAKSKRSNAKAKQDEVSLESMVESTKPTQDVKVAKPAAKSETLAAVAAAPKQAAAQKTEAEPTAKAPAEAKPAAKKTAPKKAVAKAEPEVAAEAAAEAPAEAKPAAKKAPAKKAAAKAQGESEAAAEAPAKPAAKKAPAKKAAAKAEPEGAAEAPVEAKPAAKKAPAKKAAAKAQAEPEAAAEAQAETKLAAKKAPAKKAAAKAELEAAAEAPAEVKPAAKKAATKAQAEPEAAAEAPAKPVAKKTVTKKAAKAEPDAAAEAPAEAKPAAKKAPAKKAVAQAEPEAAAEAPVEAKPAAKKTATKKAPAKKAAAQAEPEAAAEAPAEAKPAAKKAATKKDSAKKAAAQAEPEAAAEGEAKPVAKKAAVKKAAAKPTTKKTATKKSTASDA